MSENTASWGEIDQWKAKAESEAMRAYRASLKTPEARENATYEDLKRIQPQPEVLRLTPADLVNAESWVPYTCRESSKDYGYDPGRDDSEAPRPLTTIEQLRKRKEWRGVQFGTQPTTVTERGIGTRIDVTRDERKAITIPEETFEAIGFEMGKGEARFGRPQFSGSIRLVTGKELNAARVEAWRTREAEGAKIREAQRAKEQAERDAEERERRRTQPFRDASAAAERAAGMVTTLERDISALDGEAQNIAIRRAAKAQALHEKRGHRERAFADKHRIAAELRIDPETGKPLPSSDT